MYKTLHVIHQENILDLLPLFSQEISNVYTPQIQLKMAQMYTVQLLSYAIFTGQTVLKLMEKLKQWMQVSVKMCQKHNKEIPFRTAK